LGKRGKTSKHEQLSRLGIPIDSRKKYNLGLPGWNLEVQTAERQEPADLFVIFTGMFQGQRTMSKPEVLGELSRIGFMSFYSSGLSAEYEDQLRDPKRVCLRKKACDSRH